RNGRPAAGFAIVVADNGCGLPSDLGDRIFQPFVSTKETGMGLGLSICRRIVQAHGGQITATNLTGGGSAFTIWLPCGSESPVIARIQFGEPASADTSRELLRVTT